MGSYPAYFTEIMCEIQFFLITPPQQVEASSAALISLLSAAGSDAAGASASAPFIIHGGVHSGAVGELGTLGNNSQGALNSTLSSVTLFYGSLEFLSPIPQPTATG